jgi:hypothetical protein
MSGYGYQKKWLRAGKVMENYICGGPWANSYGDGEYQLYHAVMDGEIRARINGKAFNDFNELRKTKWSPDSLYALPFDLELNLEDVRRIWDWSKYDVADMLARGVVSPASAAMSAETGILNLKMLLERVRVRLTAMSLTEALTETDFSRRWADLTRSLDLYFGSRLIDPRRQTELLAEYEKHRWVKEENIDKPLKKPPPKSSKGRKATYDWDSAASHIAELFEHHGPLSHDDPDWSCQADVERNIQQFFSRAIGREPATSTTRDKAREMIERHMGGNFRPNRLRIFIDSLGFTHLPGLSGRFLVMD